MRLLASPFFLLILMSSVSAQEKVHWQRFATFADYTADLDTSQVTFSTAFSGRVRFRISLSKPEPISKANLMKYRSVIETFEFQCEKGLFLH